MKPALLVILILLATAVLGHMHGEMQRYHPVVKLATPEGLVYTALLAPASGRPACGEAHRVFMEPFRSRCPACEVLAARCERELAGLELALERERPLPHHVVVLPGIRMAIAGPQSAAQVDCAFIAADVARRSKAKAACIAPVSASTGS